MRLSTPPRSRRQERQSSGGSQHPLLARRGSAARCPAPDRCAGGTDAAGRTGVPREREWPLMPRREHDRVGDRARRSTGWSARDASWYERAGDLSSGLAGGRRSRAQVIHEPRGHGLSADTSVCWPLPRPAGPRSTRSSACLPSTACASGRCSYPARDRRARRSRKRKRRSEAQARPAANRARGLCRSRRLSGCRRPYPTGLRPVVRGAEGWLRCCARPATRGLA